MFPRPRPRPGVVLLVILVNEIARVGRYLGYCWLVGLVGGCDLGGFGDVGTCIGSCREGGEGRSWMSVGGLFGEGLEARRIRLQQGLDELVK